MTKHLYRTLTWTEARERAQQGSVIVIPVAAIEQHGYHLPIDTDNVLVEQVTEEAACRSAGLILTAPMIHYGFNEHNMGFPGTISVRETVFIDFCYDVAHSFVRQGSDRILYVNGHGSNQRWRRCCSWPSPAGSSSTRWCSPGRFARRRRPDRQRRARLLASPPIDGRAAARVT
ncbi:MAG: creatininase family protein [Acidobacteria bacterium]|nr:creatininase family protein [Acidobacteriota bacterium]